MGALDPHAYKRNQQSLPGSHGDVTRAANDPGQHIRSMDELPMDLWPSFATSEDYYSTVGPEAKILFVFPGSTFFFSFSLAI